MPPPPRFPAHRGRAHGRGAERAEPGGRAALAAEGGEGAPRGEQLRPAEEDLAAPAATLPLRGG